MTAYLLPIGLLFVSNIFMTFAWYGPLGDIPRPVWLAVLLAWGIAFFDYCLAGHANRIGHAVYSTAEIKKIQEVITLIVFAGFAHFWLDYRMKVHSIIAIGRSLSWDEGVQIV